jgi:hypothetical protein
MDLRLPSGLFFALLGIILCAVGLVAPGLRAPLVAANVNLWSGLLMLLFGGVLLWLSRSKS